MNVIDRLIKIEAVPGDHVPGLIRLADLSIIPVLPSCESYRLGLPNKLFQSLQAGTSIVATPLPEVAAILNAYGGGVVTRGFGSSELLEGILKAKAGVETNCLPDRYSAEDGAQRIAGLVWALVRKEPIPELSRYDFDRSMLEAGNWKPDGKGLRPFLARICVRLMRMKIEKNTLIEHLKL